LVRDILSYIAAGAILLGPGQMAIGIGRREFIGAVGGAAVAWPLAARAQQPALPVIGFLNGTSPQGYDRFLLAFRQGLGETGFTEDRNVAIEYRWAGGDYERLPAMAADLVRRGVNVIAATSTPANVVAAAATKDIPIVFTTSSDPVELGLVRSLSHPGGNATGAVTLNVEMGPKRLELLHDIIPMTNIIGVLINSSRPGAAEQSLKLEKAGQTLGLQIRILNASTERDVDAAVTGLAELPAKALLVTTDAFFFSRRSQLIDLVARHAIPTIFDRREFVEAGGLMSYGGSVTDVYRLAGNYTGQILKGGRPAEMPVQQSTKIELVINLKTAKALGLTVSPSVLATADEVIE
jgi:putative ABC transport system substrate-binding protein